ncbi:MAG: DoxX family membrane protein [Candidatus Nomurabacteria bacterium]|nr:DoxX family membrane protein [Candidatus Nomurabacteria bacterium]USN87305.1 MAG: DoxX family membrane protein [Candidatus Nomurabacteria bacterium]
MLNPFPIQFLALFAYFLLRVITGLVLLTLGYKHWKSRKELFYTLALPIFPHGKFITAMLIFTEILIGVMLIIGWYTQIAALILILLSIKTLIFHKHIKHGTIPGRLAYILLFGIGLSLFITGAGVFAFDLPI